MARDPIAVLADMEDRARQSAVGLPRVEEIQEIWQGIGFAVAGFKLAVAVQDLREMGAYPALTPVPGTKSWVNGVANVRGGLLTIIDLGGFLRGPATPITTSSRLLVVRDEHLSVGLLVDEVLGMRHFRQGSCTEDPAGTPSWVAGYLRGTCRLGDELWGVFDIGALLGRAEFLQVAV